MIKVKIRAATRADLSTLLEFEQGIIAAERPYDVTLKPDPISYYDLGELIDSDDAQVLVAILDHVIIGSAYVHIKEGKPYHRHDLYGYLGFMFVLPVYRGQGVNKKILESLVAWSKTRNLTELRLDVYAANASAVRAYDKFGFKPDMVNMRLGI